jgi:hypothetical protein
VTGEWRKAEQMMASEERLSSMEVVNDYIDLIFD